MTKEIITEAEFEHEGLRCKVILTEMGHRCGYVQLPEGHFLNELGYDDIPVDVHGGLTFGSSETRFIGFDCAHCDDTPEIWNLEETAKETKRLAEQIPKITLKDCVMYKLRYMPKWFTESITFKEKGQ